MFLLRQLAAVLAVGVVWPAQAATVIHVDDDNCPGPGTGTEVDPFCFIQDAIDAAVDTDEILVAPGTYFETINLQGKAVDLHSAGGELVTFIDGTGLFTSVVTCNTGEGPDTVVDGFTIMNGTAFLGAGMLMSASSPTVMNCTFQLNSADAGGGGLFIQQSTATVANCTFTSNVSGFFGGALYSFASTAQIRSCAFNDNSAIQFGGAIYGNLVSSLVVIDCDFVNNSTMDSNTAQGGAIYSVSIPTVISNSDFTGNSAGHDGGGVQISNVTTAGMAIVTNCMFTQNSTLEDGGGLRFDNCQGPVVSNCQFQQNTTAAGNGGGLRLTTSPNALVTGCTFTDNQANHEGGGMDVVQSPGCTVIGCVFDSNTAWDDDGGGLQVDETNDLTITSCMFTMNTAGDDGGGLYVSDSSNVTITSCMFTANTAAYQGGGMDVDDSPNATITSCTFTANTAVFDKGGGMRLAHSAGGSVVGCDFVSNTAGNDGGGLHVHEFTNATITRCTFIDNDAGDDGGGIEVEDTSFFVTITDCIFMNNSADAEGGGLAIQDSDHITVNTCTFTENAAGSNTAIEEGGGGIDIDRTPDVTVTGCIFDRNTSTRTGGGIDRDAEPGTLFLDDCSFTGNTAVIAGAGIFSVTDVIGGDGGVSGTDEFVSLGELSPGEISPTVDCCLANGTPGCDDPGCEAIVCALDAFCCDVGWDGICAGHAMDLCGDLCSPGGLVGSFPIGVPFTQVLELAEGPALSAGTIVMDLAGTTPGTEHDHLPFTPRATLRGGLRATLVDEYAPALGDRFEIIMAPSIEGHFDVVFFPGLPDGLFMRLEIAPGVLAGGGSVTIVVDSLGSLLGFGDPESVGINGLASGVAVGDFDGQNGIDVAIALADVASGSVLVLPNAGLDAGGNWLGFLGPIQTPVGSLLSGITVGALDGDQDLDIAVSDAAGNVFVLLNDLAVSGTFIVQPAIAVGNLPSAIAAGDFGEDLGPVGDTDLVVTNAGDNTLVVLFNDGNANFQLGSPIDTGANPLAVIPCDLDNDKDLDLAVANGDSDTVSVVFNLGGGSFAPAISLGVGNTPVDLAAADFDGNGIEDIVTVNRGDDKGGAGSVSVILNESTANNPDFTPAVNLPVGSFPRSITVVDLESDEDTDIALVANNAQNEAVVQVIRNDLNQGGQLIFVEASELVTGQDPVLLITGDLDSDGTEDLITVNDAPPPPGSAGAAGPFVGSANVLLNTQCAVDIDNDGVVGLPDFETVINSWGPCPPKREPCPADFDRDMMVGIRDFLFLLAHWGPCP